MYSNYVRMYYACKCIVYACTISMYVYYACKCIVIMYACTIYYTYTCKCKNVYVHVYWPLKQDVGMLNACEGCWWSLTPGNHYKELGPGPAICTGHCEVVTIWSSHLQYLISSQIAHSCTNLTVHKSQTLNTRKRLSDFITGA